MDIKRKQLVLAAMVLALGAAVYLTWHFSGPEVMPTGTEVSGESSELGAAQLVNNAYLETAGGDVQGENEATQVNEQAGDTTADSQIAEARITRQNSRDEAIELLDNIISDESAELDAKEQAVTQASAIAKSILDETNIENLLSAKGYKDCVAYINNGDCNIVVSGEIVENDSLIIQEIVIEQTGLEADKIKIINSNAN